MIDWIKYFPLKLRETDKPESPKKPSFSRAKSFKFDIGGSILTFKALRHRSSISARKSYSVPNYRDLLTFTARSYNNGVMSNDNWLQMSFFNRYRAFCGPWFTGNQTELSMYLSIISKAKHQEGVSFFHPRAFEDAVADFLTSRYGHNSTGSEIMWRGPVNWTPITTFPVFAVLLDVMPLEAHGTGKRRQMLLLPVTDKHILLVSIEHLFSMMGNLRECNERFDAKPMEALANDILNSFKLELSPEIQAQWDKVKKDCPDMTLVKDFPPLKWPMEKIKEAPVEATKLEKK